MDHPLDDCRLKLARAKEQFDSLHAEIRQFAEANPCPVELDVDPQTGDQRIELPEPPAFPRRWGVVVGEIAHNLRSALDYLIGILVRESGREPDGNTAFPISKTRDRYLRKNKRGITYRDRLLRGVPEPLKRRIDELQPYQRGDMAHTDMLFGLSYLANRDKHRDLHPAYARINTPRRAFAFLGEIELKRVEIRLPQEGGAYAEADFKAGADRREFSVSFPQVDVQRPTGVEVVFGRDPNRLLGLEDLRGMIAYVERVLESFAGDVQPGAPTAT